MDIDKNTNTVNIGSFEKFRICKLYGPTAMCDLEITVDIERGLYVVEKKMIKTDADGNDEAYWMHVIDIDGSIT